MCIQCCVSVLEKVIESLARVHDYVLFCFVRFSVCMMEQSEFDKKIWQSENTQYF